MCNRTILARSVITGLVMAGLGLSGSLAFAQDAPANAPPPAPPTTPASRALARRPKTISQAPCWQQAGVSQEVMTQVNSIKLGLRAKENSVCEDSSLSHPQQLDKIAGLRKTSRDQIDALIPAKQRTEIQMCQSLRPHRRRRTRERVRPADPCRVEASPTTPAADSDDTEKAAPADDGAAPPKDAAPEKDAPPAKDAPPGKSPDAKDASDNPPPNG